MPKTVKIKVKKAPNGLHRYTATIKGVGTYGYGNTPAEARDQLRKANPFPSSYRQHALWNTAHGVED